MEELEDAKEICVDTDILIDYLKKKEPGSRAYERWRNKASVGVTSITVFELLLGARQANLKEKRYEEAKSFVEQQHRIFAFDASATQKASEIGAQLNRLGAGIEIRDCSMPAICVKQDIPILTRNKNHYQRVESLKMLDV